MQSNFTANTFKSLRYAVMTDRGKVFEEKQNYFHLTIAQIKNNSYLCTAFEENLNMVMAG